MAKARVIRTAAALIVSGLMLVTAPGVASASTATRVAGSVATDWANTQLDPVACRNTYLHYGSKAECVAVLQITLNALFGEKLVVDGVYGPKTTAAVYRLQARYGLTYDGRTGPQTWSQLVWCQYRAEHGLSY